MLHSYVTDMAARVTPTIQIPKKEGCDVLVDTAMITVIWEVVFWEYCTLVFYAFSSIRSEVMCTSGLVAP